MFLRTIANIKATASLAVLTLCAVSCGASDKASKSSGAGELARFIDTSKYETAAGYLSCLEGRAVVVSAHRGGPAPGYPENALETFAHTLSQVPALIETDVRETKDGVLVLMHDDTVDRTTTGTGAVTSMTLQAIKDLYLVDNEGAETAYRVPTLAEALEAMRDQTVLQLDVKRGVGLRSVVKAIEKAGASSFAAVIVYTERGADIVARESRRVTVFAPAANTADFAVLLDQGASPQPLAVWTGIQKPKPRAGEGLDAAFVRMLDDRDIPASGGTLGAIDRQSTDGETRFYKALGEQGLDIIATDRPVAAARALHSAASEEALALCNSKAAAR